MRVISRRTLREFWERYADAERPLAEWFRRAEKADWACFADLRSDYPTADLVSTYTVLNIGGNKYRLILEVFYPDRIVLVRHVLTHKEYDKGDWKKEG